MYLQLCSSRSKDVVVISLSLIVCFFAIDSFLFPILPNVRQYALSSASSTLRESSVEGFLGSDRTRASPPQAYQEGSTVIYRNAFWMPEIGHWLSQCGAAPMISISERLYSNECENGCGGRGVCNYQLAECRCFHGYGGKGCEREVEFPCMTSEKGWRVSKCGATCDKTKAFCFCGEGTKYPQRPVAEGCGFVWKSGVVNWTTPDPLIFSNSSNDGRGWCNLDPHVLSLWKMECYCTYDGTGGRFCSVPVESFCINQCSGNGQCRGGFCACGEGWYGIDCSVPSSLKSRSLEKWPTWLSASTTSMAVPDSPERNSLQLVVEKRRPLIYVYDLPAEFNSHLLEGRHFRLWCSTRTYDGKNKTEWLQALYGSEPALVESLLASPHRTTNAEEADYFYVPTFEACARSQADSAPHTDMQNKYLGLRGYYAGAFHKRAYDHIKKTYPYWNRSGGKDHIWMFAWDEGACSAPKEIWSSIMLVHWGNTQSKHNYSTSAYDSDRWTYIPKAFRGVHPCYDPSKDIVLPAWKMPDPEIMKQNLWARPREERTTLFYFNGNLGSMFEGGRPEEQYSMGIRQRLAEEFGSRPNRDGQIGRQSAPDVTVISGRTREYGLELSRSRFCGVFPGDGWSSRMEDSILHGCIPVIIQDGIRLPFEDVLDYSAFTIRIAENELPDMVRILRGISETRIDFMLSAVRMMWQRFSYHNAVKLEAKRQELLDKTEEQWATEYNSLVEDDAFTTLIQVLHFKLKNRSWQTASTEVTNGRSDARDYCGNP
ncbi:unnamed protein product [Calypogeia fissa]